MKILKIFFNRIFIVLVCAFLQLTWTVSAIMFFSNYFLILSTVFKLLSVFIILGIVRKERHLTNKLPWIIIIMLFPILGAALFVLMGTNFHTHPILKKIKNSIEESNKYLVQDKKIMDDIKSRDLNIYGQLEYISNYAGYPIYRNSKIDYFKVGEEAFPIILQELEKAKKFIFIEYFIIQERKILE